MENESKPGRKPQKISESPTVRLDAEAVSLLRGAAKATKLTKGEYASACIKYFARIGLDPTAEASEGLAGLNATLLKETMQGRAQAALIGNRLMSVIRTWEKNLYTFLQEQQVKSLNYQEQVENTLHRQHTAVETNLLTPMASMLIRAEIEQTDTRYLSAMALMKLNNYSEARQELVLAEGLRVLAKEHVEKMREFIQTNHVAKPQPTPKPGVTPRPAVVNGTDSMKTDKEQGIPLEAQVKKDNE